MKEAKGNSTPTPQVNQKPDGALMSNFVGKATYQNKDSKSNSPYPGLTQRSVLDGPKTRKGY